MTGFVNRLGFRPGTGLDGSRDDKAEGSLNVDSQPGDFLAKTFLS